MAISVTVSPSSPPTLALPYPCYAHTPKAQQALGAVVTGDVTNAGVTWAVSQGAGSVLQTTKFAAIYYPPDPPPGVSVGAKVTVTATSVTDKTKTSSATVAY